MFKLRYFTRQHYPFVLAFALGVCLWCVKRLVCVVYVLLLFMKYSQRNTFCVTSSELHPNVWSIFGSSVSVVELCISADNRLKYHFSSRNDTDSLYGVALCYRDVWWWDVCVRCKIMLNRWTYGTQDPNSTEKIAFIQHCHILTEKMVVHI